MEDEYALKIYLQEIHQIPILTREEEEECALRIADGDRMARDLMIRSNLRFVVSTAKKYQHNGLPFADLINEGNLGLLRAVEKFDVSRGYRFISYAVWWIKQSILKAISEKSRLIRIPLNRINDVLHLESLKGEMPSAELSTAQIREVAERLHLETSEVEKLLGASREPVSLDIPLYEQEDSVVYGSTVEDKLNKTPEELAVEQSLREEINKTLLILSKREADVIRFRFGLSNTFPLSLSQLADRYNLTKERIRQIEKRAKEKLRRKMKTRNLDLYGT